MDSWERFAETRLPDKENFYSKLNDEHITDEEYAHAQAVWEAFECKTLGDYLLPRAVRVRSGALFDVARPLLGRALEKDGGRA